MPDPIPLIEPVVNESELEKVRAVLESGYLTQGPYAREFEDGIETVTGADHGIAVTSCTRGLELAFEAFGVSDGDEVILPDFTYPATATAVRRVGAIPVLVDVDRRSWNIDPDTVRRAVSDRTTAIAPVSWGGRPLDPAPLTEIAADHDLVIVEDAACSLGAAYDGVPVGSQFDASVFSFHPRKPITTGEGGVITLTDDAVAARLRRIKNFGADPEQEDLEFTYPEATNARFSDVLAAVGVAQLEKLDSIVETRRDLGARYTDLLSDVDGVVPPIQRTPERHVFQSYCVFVEAGGPGTRDRLMERLDEQNIETQIGTYALHRTTAFADAKSVGELDTSRQLYERLLTLPLTHTMTKSDQHRIVDTLSEAL